MLYLHGEGQPCVLAASKEPGVALARGRARTANTGAGACYIRPVKLRPLLFPKGTVPSLSSRITQGAAWIRGSTARSTQLKRARKRRTHSLTFYNLCPSRGQSTLATDPWETAHLGTEKGRYPLIHLPCWSLVLEESPPSPACCLFPLVTHQPSQGYSSLHLS